MIAQLGRRMIVVRIPPTWESTTANEAKRKRSFSGGDVCGVAPVPPPAGD